MGWKRAALADGASTITATGMPARRNAAWNDDPATMPDRRRSQREPLNCGARLELAGRAWAVNLLNLSEGGAAVNAPTDVASIGAEGHLVFDTAVVGVRVVSVHPDRLGLSFGRLTANASRAICEILAQPLR